MGDAPTLALPPHKQGRHDNPTWNLLLNVEVTRMDHSLAMTQHAGTMSIGTKPIAEVGTALGGFVFIVSMQGKSRPGSGRYALDLTEAIKEVCRLHPALAAVPEYPHPQKPGAVPRRKRRKRR